MSVRDSLDVVGDRLRTTASGMAPRERLLVGFTAVVLLCFVGYFTADAMKTSTRRVQSNISLAAQAQARVDSLLAEYSQLSSEAESLDARLAAGKDFAPLTWLESVGNEMGIQGNIRSVTERGNEQTDYYQAQKIDMIVDDLDLRQLVDLMYRLEQAPQAIRINEARIKADRKNRSQLDLRMEIAVLKPLESS